MINRRRFVSMNATLLMGAALFNHAGRAAPQLDARMVQFSTGLSQDKFIALIGELFYLYDSADAMMIAHLVEVTAHPSPAGFEQFSLLFQVPSGAVLSAGLYRADHLIAGRTLIHLTPSATRAPQVLYRADFNLRRSALASG